MITKNISTEDKLIALVKTRVIELRTQLKNVTNAKEKYSLQQAIASNCGWLLTLGCSLNIPELEEV